MYEQTTNAGLEQRVERLESALPHDSHGKPKYYETRQFLTNSLRDDELISEIKDDAIKQIVKWFLVVALAGVAAWLGLSK